MRTLIRANLSRFRTMNGLYVSIAAAMVGVLYAVLALIEDDPLFAQANRYSAVSAAAPSALLVLLVVALLFVVVFLLYMNTLLVERRADTIAVYRLLGMPARRLGLELFLESLLLGAVTLVLGFATGLLFSKFLAMMLLRMMALPLTVGLLWAPHAMLELTALFVVVYAVIGLINAVYAGNVPIARSGRQQPLPAGRAVSGWRLIAAGLGALVLIGSYVAAYNLVHLTFTVSQRFIGSGLVAVALVMLATLCGLYLLFRVTLPVVTTKLAQRPWVAHSAVRLFTVTNLNKRLQKNVHSLFLTTVLVTLTMTTLGSGAILYQFGQAEVSRGVALDVAASPYGLKQTYGKLKPSWIKRTVVLPTKLVAGRLNTAAGGTGDGDETFYNVIALSDYRRVRRVQRHLPAVSLTKGRAVMVMYGRALYQHTWLGTRKSWTISLPRTGQRLAIQRVTSPFPLGVEGYFDRALVVTDAVYDQLKAPVDPMTSYQLKKGAAVSAYIAQADGARLYDYVKGNTAALTGRAALHVRQTDQTASYSRSALRFRAPAATDMNVVFGLGLFIVVLLGVIFMLATASILLMKQLMIAVQDKQTRRTLRQLGMPEAAQREVINRQTAGIFALPLVLGAINSGLIIRYFSLFLDDPGYGLVIAIAAIFALVYAGFGALTARLVNATR